MAATVVSCAVVGLDAIPVEITVAVGRGPSELVCVGLPDADVQGSHQRLRAAIRSSGAHFPDATVTVHLAPVDLVEEGQTFDLPIATGILIASGQLITDVSDALLVGALSPDGVVQRTPGILTMVAMAATNGVKRAFVAVEDADEAGLIEGIAVYPTPTLAALVAHLNGEAVITPLSPESLRAAVE